MELTEPVESINQQLVDHFGIDTSSGQPMFRVVWAPDQFTKRVTRYTESGLLLLHPEIKLLPKYKQWIGERWILERLVSVPKEELELTVDRQSYECIWKFEDKDNNYLPPRFDASKFVIDCLYAAIGKKSLRKYIENPEDKVEEVNKLYDELFGNETPVGDALSHKSGVTVQLENEKCK